MDSKRQNKVSRLIQKELSEIFQRNSRGMFDGAFITVTHCKITPDLGLARIYLSFMLTNSKEETLQIIEENNKLLRGELGRKIGKQIRKIPELEFFIDNTQEEVDKIQRLFANIDIPPAENEDSDPS